MSESEEDPQELLGGERVLQVPDEPIDPQEFEAEGDLDEAEGDEAPDEGPAEEAAVAAEEEAEAPAKRDREEESAPSSAKKQKP